jgi:hypothetical protein
MGAFLWSVSDSHAFFPRNASRLGVHFQRQKIGGILRSRPPSPNRQRARGWRGAMELALGHARARRLVTVPVARGQLRPRSRGSAPRPLRLAAASQ